MFGEIWLLFFCLQYRLLLIFFFLFTFYQCCVYYMLNFSNACENHECNKNVRNSRHYRHLTMQKWIIFLFMHKFFLLFTFLGFLWAKKYEIRFVFLLYLLITNNKKHKPKVLRTTFLCLLVFLLKNVPLEWFSLFFSLFELSSNFWTLITWDLLSLWRFGRFLSLPWKDFL